MKLFRKTIPRRDVEAALVLLDAGRIKEGIAVLRMNLTTRRCKSCGTVKDITEYYEYRNECIECHIANVRARQCKSIS